MADDVLEFESLVCLARDRNDLVCQLLGPRFDSAAQLPSIGFVCRQSLRDRRILCITKSIIDGLRIPVAVKLSRRNSPAMNKREQRQLVTALVRESFVVRLRFKRIPGIVEILGADVKRLMYVTQIMREQYDRNCLRNRVIVVLRLLAFQHANAERNHVHDVKVLSTNCTIGIILVAEHRDICEVK